MTTSVEKLYALLHVVVDNTSLPRSKSQTGSTKGQSHSKIYACIPKLTVCQGSLDRGYGRCQVFRKNTALIRKYPNGTYVRHSHDRGMSLIFTRFDRLAGAPIDETTKKKVKKFDTIDGDVLAMAGGRVDPGDVYVNKQTPTNANDNTTVSAVVAGFKNTPLTYKAPVSGYIDKVRYPSYFNAVRLQYYT